MKNEVLESLCEENKIIPETTKCRVAIVILNWNGKQMMERFLPSVCRHSMPSADVWVADNDSTDGSLDFLHSRFPQVKTIALEENWGFAEGYNKALAQIDADYFVLLNSDVEVTENWLQPLLCYMDDHQEVAACMPKLLSESRRDTFEYAGAAGGFLDKYGYAFCRGRIFDVVEKDCGQYDGEVGLMWVTGACMMVRSADYRAAGGLDSRFFAHFEEIDLCWRLRTMGRKLVCVTQSHVFHVGGGTLPQGNPMKTYLNFRNNLTMLYKNLPERELKHVLRVRCWLDWLAAMQMLLKGNLGDFKAVARARRDFKKSLPQFNADRLNIHQHAVETHIPERMPFSILWKYYVKRLKHFSDLNIQL